MQPKLGELATKALGIVASLGGGLLMFAFAFVVAGIMMAWGEPGAQAMLEIFERIFGMARGKEFDKLSTATVRAVAAGVIGIACIQALIIGVSLMIAGVPFAGVLAVVVLVLGVAQLPALLVTLPVIGWIWASGEYATVPAAAYSVLLFVGGMADNVLKPIMLGRGVDAPMPVILIGALGGMATSGILGMFIGATALALGYQIFMRWVDENPERARQQAHGRLGVHHRLSRCGSASPAEPARAWPPSPPRFCSAAAPLSGRTSSGPRCSRWPTGRADRWQRWRRNSAAGRERRPRNGGATSTTRCLTRWSPRRSASTRTCAQPACASWRRARNWRSPVACSTRSSSR
jgi:hypothetical protein